MLDVTHYQPISIKLSANIECLLYLLPIHDHYL